MEDYNGLNFKVFMFEQNKYNTDQTFQVKNNHINYINVII